MTLEEYKSALQKHDWFHYFSDDNRVCMAGERVGAQLLATAKKGDDEFKRAYNAAHAKRFNTPSFVYDGHPYKVPFPEAVDLMDDPVFK